MGSSKEMLIYQENIGLHTFEDQRGDLHIAIYDRLKSSMFYGRIWSYTLDDDEQEFSWYMSR